ncbi:TlpA family protein disulfide reductase [Dactylosporangium sp. NPDC048998]|uniref:TlpA family protein disulfide reductase n=1 Tax=Dactylosporangium sp. NPDC048998 TaxID=3363976 RepID=UPI003713637E
MRGRLLLVGALLLGLAACTADVKAPTGAGAPTGPRCIERASPAPPESSGPSAPSGGTGSGPVLPAMALPCFSGGRFTDVADLGGQPTIVNLWASWCTPCRVELPTLAQFAADGAGRVRVVGVVTRDRHDQAQSVIDEMKLTFPMLEDQGQQLAIAVSPLVSKALMSALPATLFITPDGRIAYAYQGEPLTEARLKELTQQYLGVSV